jgi:hypothetical protein
MTRAGTPNLLKTRMNPAFHLNNRMHCGFRLDVKKLCVN